MAEPADIQPWIKVLLQACHQYVVALLQEALHISLQVLCILRIKLMDLLPILSLRIQRPP